MRLVQPADDPNLSRGRGGVQRPIKTIMNSTTKNEINLPEAPLLGEIGPQGQADGGGARPVGLYHHALDYAQKNLETGYDGDYKISASNRDILLNDIGWAVHTLNDIKDGLNKKTTSRVCEVQERLKKMKRNIKHNSSKVEPSQTWDEEDETMRTLTHGADSPLPRLLSQESLPMDESLSTNGQKRSVPETERTPESSKRHADPVVTEVRELEHMAHAELATLQNILENDLSAKRITVTQRKELLGSYNRIASVVRDITYEYAKMAGENTALRNAMNTLKSVQPAQSDKNCEVTDNNSATNKSAKSIRDRLGPRVKDSYADASKRQANNDIARKKPSKAKGLEKVISDSRKTQAGPTFILDPGAQDQNINDLRKNVWTQVLSKTRTPRVRTVQRQNGITLIPDDASTLEVLRNTTGLIEVGPRKPRLVIMT
jgi:hypothetical protein